jgi:hypothetical protein
VEPEEWAHALPLGLPMLYAGISGAICVAAAMLVRLRVLTQAQGPILEPSVSFVSAFEAEGVAGRLTTM